MNQIISSGSVALLMDGRRITGISAIMVPKLGSRQETRLVFSDGVLMVDRAHGQQRHPKPTEKVMFRDAVVSAVAEAQTAAKRATGPSAQDVRLRAQQFERVGAMVERALR